MGRLSYLSILLGCVLSLVFGQHPRTEWRQQRPGVGEDQGSLFLTPLLDKQDIASAQQASRVLLFEEKANVTAHSGFITINSTLESNLFFLHLRAQNHPETAPLMLWLQGGPGKTALFGEFIDNGPLGIDDNGRLYRRNLTLQRDMNMVYLDQPVGAGFSFTKNPAGFARTLEDMGEAIEKFLRQFLVMFPEYKFRDFYVAGESYGARAALALAHRWKNNNKTRLPLNLSGVICGVPFVAPVLEVMDSSQFLYQAGLLSANGRDQYATRFQQLRVLAEQNRTAALGLLMLTTGVQKGPKNAYTLFQNLTGYNSYSNVLDSEAPAEFGEFYRLAATPEFHRALHVDPSLKLESQKHIVVYQLGHFDFFTDISRQVREVLDSQKVLLYSGQMDVIFPAANLESYVEQLQWSGTREFQEAMRKPWYPRSSSSTFTGYSVRVQNFTYAVVFRAGHHAFFDQRQSITDLINEFVERSSVQEKSHRPRV